MSDDVKFKAQNAESGHAIELFLSVKNSSNVQQKITWKVTLPQHLKPTAHSKPLTGENRIPPFQTEVVCSWMVTQFNQPISSNQEIVADLSVESSLGFFPDGCRTTLAQLFQRG